MTSSSIPNILPPRTVEQCFQMNKVFELADSEEGCVSPVNLGKDFLPLKHRRLMRKQCMQDYTLSIDFDELGELLPPILNVGDSRDKENATPALGARRATVDGSQVQGEQNAIPDLLPKRRSCNATKEEEDSVTPASGCSRSYMGFFCCSRSTARTANSFKEPEQVICAHE
mmetsp:Transcript_17371/g.34774  ORF Transcript_17371/g.34774 Transcript_17371/m.34774 type:complete len:171 (-) Transcript_17371:28-540(-)|eukprot:CAMPEP_0196723928 /NCGR_PEP_ID=MMETSP1091-20130531/5969_1 /TAXON_ID=302021 /ORGANISM="Rhodomonas sp., Strain CCMP768" /LENGTH=170 /DNA_ID=CAMNT_0042065981 /DNA_START=53 /DNA_END=565 /DNA_ORIENTATION=-